MEAMPSFCPPPPAGGSQGCRTPAGEAVWEPARGRACFLYSPFTLAATCLFRIFHLKRFAALLAKQHLRQCAGEKSVWFGIEEVSIKRLYISQKANCLKSLPDDSPNQNKL